MKTEYRNNVEPTEFLDRLRKWRERDFALGSTSVGVHKDDLAFLLNGNDARVYASQGQKRTISLSLKLAEIELIKAETGEKPVLLLDDVLSELDDSRQKELINGITDIQTLITCTGVNLIKKGLTEGDNVTVFNVDNGRIFGEKNR